jgi:hypothetical protein
MMKRSVRLLLLGGALVAASFATAAPASAGCYNDPDGVVLRSDLVAVCTGNYDHCEAAAAVCL